MAPCLPSVSNPKDKCLIIVGRLLSVEVIVGLGGLNFDRMDKGKGRGFDGTFRLSTLAMVVIFLSAAFSAIDRFSFCYGMFVCRCNNCRSYANLVLFVVLVCLFSVLNNNDGISIIRAHGLFTKFRSWRFVSPTRLVAMQDIFVIFVI